MKLNIGCGKKYEPYYCNIDLYESLVADKLMSAVSLEFEENSSEEIKVIHLIEHLTFFEVVYALSEFYRVLEPRGKLIIETPDLQKACQDYVDSNNEQQKQILGWLYGIPHKGLQHKLCFPPFLLIEILENTGFVNLVHSKFFNEESIPSIRLECYKKSNDVQFDIFQIISKLRKELIINDKIDFNEAFLTKEQEDIISFIKIKLNNVSERNETIYDLVIELLTKWPDVVEPLLETIRNLKIITEAQYTNIHEVLKPLKKVNIINILYHSISEGPINPGSQKIISYSVESFVKKVLEKLLYSRDDRTTILENLIKSNQDINENGPTVFSAVLLERKAFDLYYLGIKAYHKESYKQAYNFFLRAIKFNRDNYLFFWNLGKTLVELKSFPQAVRVYKKTLRLLKIAKIQNKQNLKLHIKNELNQIKKEK